MNFWFFAIATFLTLPKQIILVYFGVLLAAQNNDNTVNYLVTAGTFIITVIAGAYIYREMRKTKKILLAEQEARLSAKRTSQDDFDPNMNSQPEDFSQPEYRTTGRAVYLPTPQAAEWEQSSYELQQHTNERPPVKQQEFV